MGGRVNFAGIDRRSDGVVEIWASASW